MSNQYIRHLDVFPGRLEDLTQETWDIRDAISESKMDDLPGLVEKVDRLAQAQVDLCREVEQLVKRLNMPEDETVWPR